MVTRQSALRSRGRCSLAKISVSRVRVHLRVFSFVNIVFLAFSFFGFARKARSAQFRSRRRIRNQINRRRRRSQFELATDALDSSTRCISFD